MSDEYEFHMRVMKAMLINRRNEAQVRKYFHSMDIRMGKLRPGAALSSHNRKKRVDVQMAKYKDWPHEKDVPDERRAVSRGRQVGKSQALSAMYGSNPNLQSATWWSSFNPRDVVRADEEYRTSVLNK